MAYRVHIRLRPPIQPALDERVGVGGPQGQGRFREGLKKRLPFTDTSPQHSIDHAGHCLFAFLLHKLDPLMDGGMIRPPGIKELVKPSVENRLGPSVWLAAATAVLDILQMAKPPEAAMDKLTSQTRGELSVCKSPVF